MFQYLDGVCDYDDKVIRGMQKWQMFFAYLTGENRKKL